MRKAKIKEIISDALVYRGYSEAEAAQFIRRAAEPIKPMQEEAITKTIDIYA